MLNARHIQVSKTNSSTGKFSLQASDITDIIENNMKALVVTFEDNDTYYIYTGDELFSVAKRAIANGRIFSKEGKPFYLVDL